MSYDANQHAATDIAIIGYTARFPGAENAAQFWENLQHGVESIRSFSTQELESAGVSAATLRDPDYVRAGAPLSQLDAFDAAFFGINPRDAAIMDPQQRFLLEAAWEALEHAGYAPGKIPGSTGVYAGSGPSSYLVHNLLNDPELVAKEGLFALRHTGNDTDVLATRLSYQLNLRGPSLNVQAACSTSLVAVHLACQSLLNLDCDLALAGAVSIEVPHAVGYPYRQNEIQSHDGHCRSFDASATGTVFGSGLGLVVLKRLSEAVAAGDTIHAVIKGTAVNNDGNRKVGFLAPSMEGQSEVILEALGAAGVEPASIGYVEAHGTGTPIGDPIELSALGHVFTSRENAVSIGSVKGNVGHLATASGMAGLLKTVLALRHGQIPPTLHFKTLNPLANGASSKIRVVDELTEWKSSGAAPRRAGVTSLGIGGTNAHIVLEEAPAATVGETNRALKIFTISAKSPAALDAATRAFAAHLRRFPHENLADAAYTLHVGRAEFPHRRMFLARDRAEALRCVDQPTGAGVLTGKAVEPHPVAFLFPGEGSQFSHGSAELYHTEPVFKKWINRCAELAAPYLDLDLKTLISLPPETSGLPDLPGLTQPALFAIEFALAQLWISWGVVPARLLGQGVGEIAAACISGIFSLEDAISIVCARGNSPRESGALSPVGPITVEKPHGPRIPLISSHTGTWPTKMEATDPQLWAHPAREDTHLRQGLALLLKENGGTLLEIGPGETLTQLARQIAGKSSRAHVLPCLPAATGTASDTLTALGHLWVSGVTINWDAFHAHEKLHRIPLPTYPFQRQKLWIGPKTGTNWLADSLEKVDDWFYRTNWKPAPLPEPTAPPGICLVLGDAASEGLVVELRRQQATVVTVTAGDKFAATGEDSYVVNSASVSDYALLFDHLIRRRQVPRQVIHLWGLEPSATPEDRCFHSLLFLIQTLGARLPDQSVAISAVSHCSISTQREPVLHPYGSLLTGPCRVAPLEYPTLRCRQVDVDSTEPAALAALLLREGESDTTVSLAVYRGGVRWVEGIERFHLEAAPDRLRKKGVYLITGGIGGLGLAIADWLARSHQARLVLLSRNAEAQAVAHEKLFAEWRELGADLLVITADVNDRDSLRPALERAHRKFGALDGIIHAAGILHDGIIQLKKKDVAQRVLAPKTLGIELLDELTRDQSLDFFALFSSVSALTPPDGQVDYCAANAFLHAYAQSQPAARNFTVIAWAPWTQIGMVAPKSSPVATPTPFDHPLLDGVELDTSARTIYRGMLSTEQTWALAEHRFHEGDFVLPAAAYLEMAVTALWKKIGRQPITLENMALVAPLRVEPNVSCLIRAELRKLPIGYQFSLSFEDVVYASGPCRSSPGQAPRIKLKDIQARCPIERDSPRNVRQRGHFDFGPRWQGLGKINFGQNECLGFVELPTAFRSEIKDFALHPALMDVATGMAMYLIPGYAHPGDLLLPFAYKRVTVYGTLPGRVHCHARMRPESGSDLLLFDLTLATDSGEVVVEIEELTIRRLRSVADLATKESVAATASSPNENSGVELLHGIPTREGIEALKRIMKSRPVDTIYVSPFAPSPVVPMRESATLVDSVIAPSDDIDLVLEQLWQRLLGLDHVDAQTDFFDSGGHSLLAVRLFTEIRKRFNINFGLSTLFEARTVGALAELIRRSRDAHPSQKEPVASSGLVAIRSSDTATAPLFLIHDVGGGVLRYEHLARHFPEHQTIYAIESRGLSGHPTDFTVEGMATHYLKQIRERQPHGPYFLAGHSFGGLVTYEIARQLLAQGEPLGLVGLLDTFQRGIQKEDFVPYFEPRTLKLSFFGRFLTDARALVLGQDRVGYLQERTTFIQAWAIKTTYRTAFKLSRHFGWIMPSFLNDVKEANWIASDNFTPRPFDGEIVLFRCLNRLETDPPDSSRIWYRMARGGVVVHDVPGDHNSMLREPGVAILAEQILSYLRPRDT